MKQLISPTIFATSIDIYKKKLELLNFSKVIHLDICDGHFVKTKTINLKNSTDSDFLDHDVEVHLMVEKPLDYLDDCIRLGVFKVFIHREIFFEIGDFIEVKNSFEKKGIEVALVLNPETQVENALPFIGQVNHIMLMSVIPGAEGQSFMEHVLDKVRQIRVLKEDILIQIDGGINLETGKLSLDAGIDVLSVGSFISSSQSPKKNFDSLSNLK